MLVVGGVLHDGSEWAREATGSQIEVWAPAFDIRRAMPWTPDRQQYLDDGKGTSFGKLCR